MLPACMSPQIAGKACRRHIDPYCRKLRRGKFSSFPLSHDEVMRCLCLGGCIEYHLGVILQDL
jgi:hypothetical protein